MFLIFEIFKINNKTPKSELMYLISLMKCKVSRVYHLYWLPSIFCFYLQMTRCILALNILKWTCWSLLMSHWWGWVNYFLCRWFHVCWFSCQLRCKWGICIFDVLITFLICQKDNELLYFTPYSWLRDFPIHLWIKY